MAITLTLSELARLVDGDIVRGGLDLSFTGMASLDQAGPADISFLGNEKYYNQFVKTKAGAVIVARGESSGPPNCALLAVENPTLAFGKVVHHFIAITRQFSPGIHPGAFVDPSARLDPTKVRIHPGAVIMAGATIGDGTEIGANSTISESVVIGRDCHIMSNVSIRERCVLGDRVYLQPGAVIGADGFGYELSGGKHVKIDQVGTVEIGDDVEIGANTTIDRARFGKTIIGEGTKIDNLVQIGHNCVIGKHCLVVALTGISGSSHLGDYVTCGGQVGVAGHLSIGDHSTLTARTGVSISLPGGEIYSGRPASPFREDMKLRAYVRRLPKLYERIKSLEQSLQNQDATAE